jgi:hypothetical protein
LAIYFRLAKKWPSNGRKPNTKDPDTSVIPRIRLMRAFHSASYRLASAALGAAIAIFSPLSVRHAAAQTPRESGAQQSQDVQVYVRRDFLAGLAENLETFAETVKTSTEFGKLFYDLHDLKRPRDPSPVARGFFDRIQPAQAVLGGLGKPDHYDFLSRVYDLAHAIREDLNQPPAAGDMAILYPHTLEAAGKMGLAWVTSHEVLQQLVEAGKIDPRIGISETFAKSAGVLAYGADDLMVFVARGASSGNWWKNPETLEHGLDALNRGLWAGVGFMLGGREGADLFSNAADLTAKTAREYSAKWFAKAWAEHQGRDQTILGLYANAQLTRLAHHKTAISFEEFVNFDKQILGTIDLAKVRAANAGFGVHPPVSPPRETKQDVATTRIIQERYREVCRSGFCVRTELTSAQHADSSRNAGGVIVDPRPLSAGTIPPGFTQKMLKKCADATTPDCTAR